MTQAPERAGDDGAAGYFIDILTGLAAYYRDQDFLPDVVHALRRHPSRALYNALNAKQMASKLWLRDRLADHGPKGAETVWVLGGWVGVLSALLLADPRLSYRRVVSIDLDPGCRPVAEAVNRRSVAAGRFRAVTRDMLDIAYDDRELGRPDLVINTSCEHLAAFDRWYHCVPAGLPLVLQSNDYVAEPGHVNCVDSVAAFQSQAPMTRLDWSGALALKRYTRFMLIGVK